MNRSFSVLQGVYTFIGETGCIIAMPAGFQVLLFCYLRNN